MITMVIRGVLFDVDGTLYAFEDAEKSGLQSHLVAEGLDDRFASPAEALRLWRDLTEAEYARFLTGELTFVGQKITRTRRFLTAAGVARASEMSDEHAAAWFAAYAARKNTTRRAFDDAQPALGALASRYRLGVVSNSATGHQREKLEAIGLLGFFTEPLVCSQEHGEASRRRASSWQAAKRWAWHRLRWPTSVMTTRRTPSARAMPGCTPSGWTAPPTRLPVGVPQTPVSA